MFRLDLWRGEKVKSIRLEGLEHIIQITAADDKIYLRSYRYRYQFSFIFIRKLSWKENLKLF